MKTFALNNILIEFRGFTGVSTFWHYLCAYAEDGMILGKISMQLLMYEFVIYSFDC